MKQIFLPVLLYLMSFSVVSQNADADYETKEKGFYATINGVMGVPVLQFRDNYEPTLIGGLNFDMVYANKLGDFGLEPGIQFEVLPTASYKDRWKGLELTTSSAFIRINGLVRVRFAKQKPVSPFIELNYGLNISTSSSSYEIYDNATFWEEFLLGAEDQVETVGVKDYADYTHNFGAGLGVFLFDWGHLQIKYNYTPVVSYVPKGEVTVVNETIDYGIEHTRMQLVMIQVGCNLQRVMGFK